MRQFLLGILATVVGGIILFLITNWYTNWASGEFFQVEYQASPASGFMGASEVQGVRTLLEKDGANSGKIGLVRIANQSGRDFRNAKFIISPTESNFSSTNLHGFGLASHISGEMPDPKLSLREDGILVEFPVLEAENGSYFWILHEPPQGFRVFSESDNVELKEYSAWEAENSDLDFGFVFLIAVVLFALGVWGGNSLAMHVVKEAGYDPSQINAEYYRKLAKNEEKKSDIVARKDD